MAVKATPVLLCLGIVCALVVAECADARRTTVSTERGLRVAAAQIHSGVITLRAGRYGTLSIPSRNRGWLTIRARPGATARYLVLRNVHRVRVIGLRVKGGRVNIHSSKQVKLHRVRLVRSQLSLAGADRVTITRTRFTLCGENREACLGTGWGRWASSHIRVLNSRFHDCYGCDFIRGHIGRGFILRGSTLERAVPGPCGTAWECNHQDGVQMSRGNSILIENNRFGLTAVGAGQLYFAGPIDGLTIRNNVFFGTDTRLPDYVGWAAIVIGHHRTDEPQVPLAVSIVNNTVLTGAPRPDGLANSVFLTPSYLNIPVEYRPVVANNVLGLLRNPDRLCVLGSVVTSNIVRDADTACTETGLVGELGLNERGEPVEGSMVIDRGDPTHATIHDLRGRARDSLPDVGAFEFVH